MGKRVMHPILFYIKSSNTLSPKGRVIINVFDKYNKSNLILTHFIMQLTILNGSRLLGHTVFMEKTTKIWVKEI